MGTGDVSASLKPFNSWQNLLWALGEDWVDPKSIDRVLIQGKVYEVRPAPFSHMDRAGGIVPKTTIELRIPLPFKAPEVDTEVWINLYDNRPVCDLITKVYKIGDPA